MNGSRGGSRSLTLRRARTAAGAGLLTLSAVVNAQTTALADSKPISKVPAASCKAPSVPKKFVDDLAQLQFVAAAKAYQSCMQAFIAARREDATAHANAGNEASSTFNAFAAAAAKIEPPPAR